MYSHPGLKKNMSKYLNRREQIDQAKCKQDTQTKEHTKKEKRKPGSFNPQIERYWGSLEIKMYLWQQSPIIPLKEDQKHPLYPQPYPMHSNIAVKLIWRPRPRLVKDLKRVLKKLYRKWQGTWHPRKFKRNFHHDFLYFNYHLFD